MASSIRGLIAGCALGLLVLPRFGWSAEADVDAVAGKIMRAYVAKQPQTDPLADLDLDMAMGVQARLVESLVPSMGKVVGYKVGIVDPQGQARLGIQHPLRGTLLASMLVESPARVPRQFAAIPIIEGDLVVRVGKEAISYASNPEDVLACLDAVIPFLELPDRAFAPGLTVKGPAVAACNVGARLGVLGAPIPLESTPEWQRRLRDFRLQVVDQEGKLVAEGTGSRILGDPLKAVTWVRDSLAKQHQVLRPGDLLSLGAVTAAVPLTDQTSLRAVYQGLDPRGDVEVRVTFSAKAP